MMEGLKFSIPQRLFFLRLIVTLGLVVSFLLSLNLWGGERFFPAVPVFEQSFLKPPFDYVPVILSIVFLLSSLVFRRTRTFLTLALLINIFMVLFDINRLQPWFYIYNAMLVIFLFYDGRVDNPNKFTSVFILIQLIVAAVYIYNGINQLLNSYFMSTDLYETILPLKKITSERQFLFFLKMGQFVPYVLIFMGVGLLIRPVKYLAISVGILFHASLLVFLFPSVHNTNYALWFMNLVFGLMIAFLFSGKTQQRYFSISVLFQKPLFYMVMAAFWIMPALSKVNYWPGFLSFTFKSGSTGKENLAIDVNTYNNLPFYVKSFCNKDKEGYLLKLENWCNHELKSEYFDKSGFVKTDIPEKEQITSLGNSSSADDVLSIK